MKWPKINLKGVINLNTKAFKAKMILNDDTNETLSKVLHKSIPNVSNKINGKSPFNINELTILKSRWNLTLEEIDEIFLRGK